TSRVADGVAGADLRLLADEAGEVRLLLERAVEPGRRDLEAVVAGDDVVDVEHRRQLAADLCAVVEPDAAFHSGLVDVDAQDPGAELVLELHVDELVALA